VRRLAPILALAVLAAGCGGTSPSSEPTKSARAQEIREDEAASAHAEAEHKRDQTLGHRYPVAAQQEFIVGCKAGEASEAVCRCWLHKIEERDSLPELEALSYAITHGAAVPPGVKEDLESCKLSGG
jgi:mannitol-specific phosphotransferase system IIBC component